MTQREFDELARRPAIARRNPALGFAGVRAYHSKPTQGHALERPAPRKEKGRVGPAGRIKIRITIYSMRPADWDGWHIKELQDMLVQAGILPGDDWNILEGSVISKKAHTKAEECTIIDIEWP